MDKLINRYKSDVGHKSLVAWRGKISIHVGRIYF